MLHQAQSSAPGLDIMLVKQQFLSLSGQAANPPWQNPPVDYMFSTYTWYMSCIYHVYVGDILVYTCIMMY